LVTTLMLLSLTVPVLTFSGLFAPAPATTVFGAIVLVPFADGANVCTLESKLVTLGAPRLAPVRSVVPGTDVVDVCPAGAFRIPGPLVVTPLLRVLLPPAVVVPTTPLPRPMGLP